MEKLLEKINCSSIEELREWNEENDDAFADHYWYQVEEGVITESEYNTIMKLVNE